MERSVGRLDARGQNWDRVRGVLSGAGRADTALAERIGSLEDHWRVVPGGFARNPTHSPLPAGLSSLPHHAPTSAVEP